MRTRVHGEASPKAPARMSDRAARSARWFRRHRRLTDRVPRGPATVLTILLALLLCGRPIQAAPPVAEAGPVNRTCVTRGGTVAFEFDSAVLRTLGWQFSPQGAVDVAQDAASPTFAVNTLSSLEFGALGRRFEGRLGMDGAVLLTRDRGIRYAIGRMSIGPDARQRWHVWSALDGADEELAAFDLPDVLIDFVPHARTWRLIGSLRIANQWAQRLGAPALAGVAIGRVIVNVEAVPTDSLAGRSSEVAADADTGIVDETQFVATSSGPDVIVAALHETVSYGNNLNGISAFAVGTVSCNKGDERIDWYANTNRHPVIAQNMYRHKDGRFEQIGMSWVKHGFFAVSQSLCGPCSDVTDGTQLGVGCSDPYSASLNGVRSNMSPRSTVNPHTGVFAYPWDGWDGPPDNTTIGRRIQVPDVDLDPDLNAGATYFVEGHYLTQDDSAAGNADNNASYRPVVVSEVNGLFELSLTGFTHREWPALYAWRTIEPEVLRLNIHVPDDGTFLVAGKAEDSGGGMWHYEYAVHNLNSERAARSFIVPLQPGATVENIGFHDIDYHSGEVFDGTDWSASVGADAITWSTSDFAVDPNANALRWGTLYNFWFDADVPPNDSTVQIELFKPGVPTTGETPMIGPVLPPPECNNGIVDGSDECDPPDGVLCDSSCRLFPNDALRGGLLWDTWWAVADALEPSGEHPLYPPAGQQSGSQTFRCVECHGWDYKGVDGAYGSGVHFTGIPGVFESPGTPEELFTIIKDGGASNGHGYGQLGLSDQDIRDLVQFLLDFVIDTDLYIAADGSFTADPTQGQVDYETSGSPACGVCHGADGTALNMGTFEVPEWVGTAAVNDPQRFLHRVRFGVPGESMPAWLESGGTDQGAARIGRYAQLNLPAVCTSDPQCDDGLFCTGAESCVDQACVHGPAPCPMQPCSEIDQSCGLADPIRGGLLYDRWWMVLGLVPPAGNHPLYPPAGTQMGSATFRCKECHGWDYRGVDGAYGSGSHFTGIRGVFGSAMTPAEMYNIIMIDAVANGHDYGNLGLSEQDGWDLVNFLQSLVLDTDAFIDPVGDFLGDEVNGEILYTSGSAAPCSACHGLDGTTINFGTPGAPEWIGTMAVNNPWELMHKIRIGQPGSSMPSWLVAGGTDQEAADMGRYSQVALPVDCRNDADCDDTLFCTGIETCPDRFCVPGDDPCPGELCDEDLGTCLSGLCEPPIVGFAGARYLAVTPQPIDSLRPMALHVSSPDWPCVSQYVGGIFRCDGVGRPCHSDRDCNRCSISGDPCSTDGDCHLVGDTCKLSGQVCVPGSVEPIDINNDGLIDGTLGMLVDDPADAALLTPGDWGASLMRCTKSLAVCADDSDCDRGVCIHEGCGETLCNQPCSMAAQDCLSFCDDATQHGCDTSDDCGLCSVSGKSCRTADTCFPPGQTCILGLVACIPQTCVGDETCAPGRAYVAGRDIVPSNQMIADGSRIIVETTYDVRADCGSPGSPEWSLASEASAWLWSDVDNDGFANFTDIQLMVLGFQGSYGLGNNTPSTLLGADIVGESPCDTERVVNFTDIQAAVFAFLNETYDQRVDVGVCAGDGEACSVRAQDCADLTACQQLHDCTMPCAP